MTVAEQYLIDYLKEEFRRHPAARIRVQKEDGEIGVTVKIGSREYFFPFEWSESGRFAKIREQVGRILEVFP